VGFHLKNPLQGYGRLTFMMFDANVVGASPSSVWRVLGKQDLPKWNGKQSKKGAGFEQPLERRTSTGTLTCRTSTSAGRSITCAVFWTAAADTLSTGICGSRWTEADIEVVLELAKELHQEARPRIISDNGSQFIAKEFKEFIRISVMTRQNFALLSSGRSNAGTNRSKPSAFGGECHCPWTMRGVWWKATSSITTTCA
jgi:hypothetical protein